MAAKLFPLKDEDKDKTSFGKVQVLAADDEEFWRNFDPGNENVPAVQKGHTEQVADFYILPTNGRGEARRAAKKKKEWVGVGLGAGSPTPKPAVAAAAAPAPPTPGSKQIIFSDHSEMWQDDATVDRVRRAQRLLPAWPTCVILVRTPGTKEVYSRVQLQLMRLPGGYDVQVVGVSDPNEVMTLVFRASRAAIDADARPPERVDLGVIEANVPFDKRQLNALVETVTGMGAKSAAGLLEANAGESSSNCDNIAVKSVAFDESIMKWRIRDHSLNLTKVRPCHARN